MKKLLVFCLPFFALKSKAQLNCSGSISDSAISWAIPPCEPHSSTFHSRFQVKENYIPVNGDTSPLSVHKTIRINFIIANPLIDPPLAADHSFDSTGVANNFHNSDTAFLRSIITKANEYLANNPAPIHNSPVSGISDVQDTRFRLELEGFKFVNGTNMAWPAGSTIGPAPTAADYKDPFVTLNVFLTYSKIGNLIGGVASGVSATPHLDQLMVKRFDDVVTDGKVEGTPTISIRNFYKNPSFRNSAAMCANTLLHEIGHTLGMHHLYHLDYGNPANDLEFGDLSDETGWYDYLKDVFGYTSGGPTKYFPRPNNNGDCATSLSAAQCTNNFMGGRFDGNYRSPMQIGRMHRNASLLNCRNFIFNTYPAQEGNPDPYYGQGQKHPILFTGNDSIDFAFKSYADLRVKTGATLTITCKLIMPYYANIIVEPGAKLIIDGGTITSDDPRGWRGIMVLGNSAASQDVTGAQGIVETKNGAVIENAKRAIVLGDDRTNDFSKGGGIVRATNTTFHNNAVGVSFYTYKNFATWPAWREVNNRSFIQECQFLVDNDISRAPVAQLSIWEVRGINIQGCKFQNAMDSTRRITLEGGGSAIVSDGANYTVADYCPTAIFGIPCSVSPTPSIIKGFKYGIYALDVVRPLNFTAVNTLFERNGYAILIGGVNNVDIHNDSFVIEPNFEVPKATGFYANASTNFSVVGNKFTSSSWSVSYPSTTHPDQPWYIYQQNTVGTTLDECGSDMNEIAGNNFGFIEAMNLSSGCNTNGLKSTEDQHSGLQFRCNNYRIGSYDQFVTGVSAASDGMRCVQGTSQRPIGNTFLINPTPTIIGLSGTFHHWATETGPSTLATLPITSYFYSLPNTTTEGPTRYTPGSIGLVGLAKVSGCTDYTPGGPYKSVPKGGITTTASFGDLKAALEDTTEYRTTLLHSVYDAMNSPYADIDRTLLYFENGNIQSGNSLYNSILSTYTDMTSKENAEFVLGRRLMNVYANHYQNHKSMDTLSPGEIDTLEYVRDNGTMWAKTKACNWLYRLTGESCPLPIIDIPHLNLSYTQKITNGQDDLFNFSPNPSESSFLLNYKLANKESAILTIADLNGRDVFSIKLEGQNTSTQINAQNWSIGVYIYTINQNGKILDRGKLIKK